MFAAVVAVEGSTFSRRFENYLHTYSYERPPAPRQLLYDVLEVVRSQLPFLALAAGSCLTRNYAAAGVHRSGMRFWDAQRVWVVTLSKLVVLAWLLHRYVRKQLHKLWPISGCTSNPIIDGNAGPYARARVNHLMTPTLAASPSPTPVLDIGKCNLAAVSRTPVLPRKRPTLKCPNPSDDEAMKVSLGAHVSAVAATKKGQ